MAKCEYRDTVLRVSDVSVVYDNRAILKGVNAEVRDIVGHGQVIGLLGPSGIGKSSLLRVLAGLESPATGSVTVFSKDKEQEIPVERGLVGVVAQNYPLLRHRTVLGNLMVAARMKNGISSREAKKKAMDFLDRFHLADHANLYPSQLSGGQRQRVAIIQQLLCSEHFLLMDEPFTGLDPIMKTNVCQLIREVADMDELNTIIVVTHGIDEALCVSDTIWMMGRDRDAKGNTIPGASIKETYDLIAENLAWHKDVTSAPGYAEFAAQIKTKFHVL